MSETIGLLRSGVPSERAAGGFDPTAIPTIPFSIPL